MSDIALLVAEEYERRVKSLKKAAAGGGGGGGGEVWEIDMASSAALLVSKLKEKKQVVQRLLEPKTQFATAASNNFFSA